MKKTIEEVAREYEINKGSGEAYHAFLAGAKYQSEQMGLLEIELSHTKILLMSCEKALEDRDKQSEQMYNEEEVNQIAKDAYEMGRNGILIGVFNKWFNQFKKS